MGYATCTALYAANVKPSRLLEVTVPFIYHSTFLIYYFTSHTLLWILT